jgi:hypothetical protein
VYRLYAADDTLLYVGIAYNPKERWRSHARDRADTWWPLVARRDVEWFATRTEAAAAEVAAIVTEQPLHNVAHTNRDQRPYGGLRSGQKMYELACHAFGERPFTQADLYAVSDLSKSGVEKNVQVLREQGRLVAVGKRTNARKAGKRHTLYAVADSRAARTGELIVELAQPDGSGHVRLETGLRPLETPSRELLALIRAEFGGSKFTKADVITATGLSRAAVGKKVAFLLSHGKLMMSGARKIPNQRGYAPAVYVVTAE